MWWGHHYRTRFPAHLNSSFPSLPGVSPLPPGIHLSVAQLPLSTPNFLQHGFLTKPSVLTEVWSLPGHRKWNKAGLGWCFMILSVWFLPRAMQSAPARSMMVFRLLMHPCPLTRLHITTVERIVLLRIFPIDLFELFLKTVTLKVLYIKLGRGKHSVLLSALNLS